MGNKNSRHQPTAANGAASDFTAVAEQRLETPVTPPRRRSATDASQRKSPSTPLGGSERVVHINQNLLGNSQQEGNRVAVRIRSDKQAVLLATLASLEEGMKSAKSPGERQALIARLREVIAEYDAEIARQSPGTGQPAANPSPRDRAKTSPPARASRCRSINFPTLLYDERRHRPADGEDASEDRVECAICMSNYAHEEEVLVLPCLHWFHSKCCREWLDKRPECPLCQTDVLKHC